MPVTHIDAVFVYVADPSATVAIFVDTLAFKIAVDAQMKPGRRWVRGGVTISDVVDEPWGHHRTLEDAEGRELTLVTPSRGG